MPVAVFSVDGVEEPREVVNQFCTGEYTHSEEETHDTAKRNWSKKYSSLKLFAMNGG